MTEPQREDHLGFPETSVVEFWGFTMPVDEDDPCQSLKGERLQKGDPSMRGIVSE